MSLSYQFRLGARTISSIITDVCSAIYKVLQPQYLTIPETPEQWAAIAEEFELKWNFPMCLGALDGKHVVIESPKLSGSDFHNYKDSFSIVLLALVDADYRFIFVDVGSNGRVGDSTIWRRSEMFSAIESGSFNLPPPSSLQASGCTTDPLPYTIIADSAFALSPTLMKPYPEAGIDAAKRVFNYRSVKFL